MSGEQIGTQIVAVIVGFMCILASGLAEMEGKRMLSRALWALAAMFLIPPLLRLWLAVIAM